MRYDNHRFRLSANGAASGVSAPGILAKALTVATGAVLLLVGLMFSLVVFAVAAIVASAVLAYLWWKTRDLRRRMREHPAGGRVIDGESIRHD